VLDEHISDEFQLKDAEATMHTMTAEPYLTHVPTLTGGTGRQEVRRFYEYHFNPGWPPDVDVTPISRTVGQGRVVDELILGFTHDREMDAILPGVEPTGRRVELPHAVVVGLEHGKVAYEHTTGIRARPFTSLACSRRVCRWLERKRHSACAIPDRSRPIGSWLVGPRARGRIKPLAD
jgi:hypothetical protein